MNEKTFLRVVGIWTLLVFIINLFYVPYLIHTTSGGEQAPMVFMAKSLIVWLIICGVVFGIHRLSERK